MRLKWTSNNSNNFHQSQTPFGAYTVSHSGGLGWQWGYCFDEYYDEDKFHCESLEAGKAAAQSNWNERIEPIITQARAEGREAGLREAAEACGHRADMCDDFGLEMECCMGTANNCTDDILALIETPHEGGE